MSIDWGTKLAWAEAEHAARSVREPEEGERADFPAVSIAGASWAAGLAALALRRRDLASSRLRRAADEYRVSWEIAPPGSWGRPIAALRCRLIAGDAEGARADARWALEAGAGSADGPTAVYCAALSLLALGRDGDALSYAEALQGRADFQPGAVADALVSLARRDGDGYRAAAADVLRDFERRDAFLEDVPMADTVLVPEALAAARGMTQARLESPLLPF